MLAKEMMTAKPVTLESATPILQAAALFQERHFSSIPVLDAMGEVAGIMSELEMARAVVLCQLQPDKYKQLAQCTHLLEPATVVAPNDPTSTVIRSMMHSPSRRVLVKSEGRQILGIISPKDLLRLLNTAGQVNRTLQDEIHRLNSHK